MLILGFGNIANHPSLMTNLFDLPPQTNFLANFDHFRKIISLPIFFYQIGQMNLSRMSTYYATFIWLFDRDSLLLIPIH